MKGRKDKDVDCIVEETCMVVGAAGWRESIIEDERRKILASYEEKEDARKCKYFLKIRNIV